MTRVVYVATVDDVENGLHWPDTWVPLADQSGALGGYWASIRWPDDEAQAAADAWKAERADRRAYVGRTNAQVLSYVDLFVHPDTALDS